MNETIKTIFERKSVRNMELKPIEKSTLELLIRAGMAAPTAKNTQPWEFIAITDRKTLDALADGLPYAKMLHQAGAAIIVCADMNNEGGRTHWTEDCAAATQNILLSAESLGLGAVWTAAYPDPARIETVRKCTLIPENIEPLCVVPIGFPIGNDKPKDKYKPEKIHWERW
jgi:nitroreductase